VWTLLANVDHQTGVAIADNQNSAMAFVVRRWMTSSCGKKKLTHFDHERRTVVHVAAVGSAHGYSVL
jgi:hypothetical protein